MQHSASMTQIVIALVIAILVVCCINPRPPDQRVEVLRIILIAVPVYKVISFMPRTIAGTAMHQHPSDFAANPCPAKVSNACWPESHST